MSPNEVFEHPHSRPCCYSIDVNCGYFHYFHPLTLVEEWGGGQWGCKLRFSILVRRTSRHVACQLMRLLCLLLDSNPFWSFRAKPFLLSCFFHILCLSCVYNVHGHIFPIPAHTQVRYLMRYALDSCVFLLTVHVSGLLCGRVVVCRVLYRRCGSLAQFFLFCCCLVAASLHLSEGVICFSSSLFAGKLFPPGVDYSLGQARSFQVSCVLYDTPRRYTTLLCPCPPGAPPAVGCCDGCICGCLFCGCPSSSSPPLGTCLVHVANVATTITCGGLAFVCSNTLCPAIVKWDGICWVSIIVT